MRRLGHRMVDDLVATLEGVRERPVWQTVPEASRAFLRQPLPQEPRDPRDVYEDVRTHVLPYPTGNLHPRFWGWVMGTGSPMAMFAEMLASGLNWNVGGFDDSASLVEYPNITSGGAGVARALRMSTAKGRRTDQRNAPETT